MLVSLSIYLSVSGGVNSVIGWDPGQSLFVPENVGKHELCATATTLTAQSVQVTVILVGRLARGNNLAS